MTRRRIVLVAVLLVGCARHDTPAGTPLTAQVTMALEEDEQCADLATGLTCEDYCVNRGEISVEYLGGALIQEKLLECGQAADPWELLAGTEVVVRAWYGRAFGLGEVDKLLVGASDPIVMPASDAPVAATVVLEVVEPPRVTSVGPDPLVLGSDTLTLQGEHLGEGDGISRVELEGCAAYPPDSWSDDTVTATLPIGATGGEVRVRRCAVASEPVPIRLVGPVAQPSTVPASVCEGLVVGALAREPTQDVLATAMCPDGGRLLRFSATSCVLSAYTVYLPLEPSALAVSHGDGKAYIGYVGDGHVDVVDPGATLAVPTGWDVPNREVTALAATDHQVYAITLGTDSSTTLHVVDGPVPIPVPGVSVALELADVAAGTDTLVVAARDGGGLTKLVIIEGEADPVEWVVSSCEEPRKVAISRTSPWAAMSCAGAEPGIVAFDLQAKTGPAWIDTPGAINPMMVTLDGLGDVAMLRDGATVLIAHLGTERMLRAFPSLTELPGGPTARLGDGHTLLLADGPGFVLVNPYAGHPACGGGS